MGASRHRQPGWDIGRGAPSSCWVAVSTARAAEKTARRHVARLAAEVTTEKRNARDAASEAKKEEEEA